MIRSDFCWFALAMNLSQKFSQIFYGCQTTTSSIDWYSIQSAY